MTELWQKVVIENEDIWHEMSDLVYNILLFCFIACLTVVFTNYAQVGCPLFNQSICMFLRPCTAYFRTQGPW